MASAKQRAPFSQDLAPIRNSLKEIFPLLEHKRDWYASIYFERKASRTHIANLKQTQLSDQVRMGAVLRIYNGFTLFEHATDDIDPDTLKETAENFALRVSRTPHPVGAEKRPYQALTWKDRLSRPLENDIRSQIPEGPTSQTPVHFGIGFLEDPTRVGATQRLEHLKGIIEKLKSFAHQAGIESQDLTYIMARQGFWREESIFIDRETDMSQTLYRQNLVVVTMSGADRTYHAIGGLGGMEAIQVRDEDLMEMVSDLKSLKSAERLHPGKHRVLFGPVVSGVLAHEAFGHAQEGDTCARGRSKAWELHHSGESVGNEHATILNNPAVFENGGAPYAAWGSYYFDEEGWLAEEQVLLDQGKLCPPMTNLTSAIRLGVPRTANGKRESWANGVYTRQTNTYFSPGDRTFSELMKMMGDGYLASHPAGGMEDPKGMGIQVGISYLKEVKNGKLTGRVFKGPAGGDIQMTGYTPDVLNSILAKSKIEHDSSAPDRARFPFNDAGGCGKYHKELVFAGCGGPFMLLDSVIIG